MSVPAQRRFAGVLATLLCAGGVSALAAQQVAPQTGAVDSPALPGSAKPFHADVSAANQAKAERVYLHGAHAMEQQQYANAEADFAKAVALDPGRPEYLQSLLLSQEHRVTGLLQQAAQARTTNPEHADRLLAEARGVDAQNPRIVQRDVAALEPAPSNAPATPLYLPAPRQAPVFADAIHLRPAPGVHSFHGSTDLRALAAQLGTAYGLAVALDPDLQSVPLRMDVDDVDYASAMRIFSMLAGVFATPLDEHTVLLAADTPDNRKRLERLLEENIPLPGYSTAQITEAATMIQSVFERKAAIQVDGGSITLRAPEDTLAAINAVLSDLLDTGSEVMIDVKLYSVDSSKMRNVGVVIPTSISAFSVASEVNNILQANQSIVQQLIASGALPANATNTEIAAYLVFVAGLGSGSNLQNTFLVFGGGLTQAGLTASNFPSLNLALTASDARSLDDLELRVSDRATAIFKAGTRYPIQTSLFSDIASSSSSALAGVSVNGVSLSSLLSQYLGTNSLNSQAIVPQVQYEDLGLTVAATPTVQRGGELSLKVEVKVSALSGAALNGIPILASQQFSSTLALHDGETVLLASNVTKSQLNAVAGIPGLSEIPGFQSTTNRNYNIVEGNLVVLLTPHIVRHVHEHFAGPYIPLTPRRDTE